MHIMILGQIQMLMRPRNQWQGITLCFTRDCENIDQCIADICAVHESQDVHMPQYKNLRFDESQNSYFDIQPYSECYTVHPHFLLPTKTGWKRTPARADPFTGKSSAVMKERRKGAKRTLMQKRSRAIRVRLITEANQALLPQPQNMDINYSRPFAPKVEFPDSKTAEVSVPMDVDQTGPIMANRTKPKVPAKNKQRMGANKAKKIEPQDRCHFVPSHRAYTEPDQCHVVPSACGSVQLPRSGPARPCIFQQGAVSRVQCANHAPTGLFV